MNVSLITNKDPSLSANLLPDTDPFTFFTPLSFRVKSYGSSWAWHGAKEEVPMQLACWALEALGACRLYGALPEWINCLVSKITYFIKSWNITFCDDLSK